MKDNITPQLPTEDVEGHCLAFRDPTGTDMITRQAPQAGDEEDDVEGHVQPGPPPDMS